jgi:hypothetical protein
MTVSLLKFNTAIRSACANSGLAVSFEAAQADLQRLARMFIEPDGSFVWRGTTEDGQAWQLDGNLIDRGDVLDYVGLSGSCPAKRLDDVLAAIGWPEQAQSFVLPRMGITLTEEEFRRQAASPAGAGCLPPVGD